MFESVFNRDCLNNKKKQKLSYRMFKKSYNKLNNHEKKEVNIQIKYNNFNKIFNSS